MKKHWLILALIAVLMLALCVSLASCNGGEGSGEGSGEGGSQNGGEGSGEGGSQNGGEGSGEGGSQNGGEGGSNVDEPANHDFTYVLNENGNGYLIESVKANVTAATIPATYQGTPIVGVKDGALKNNTLTEFKAAETANTNFKIKNGILYSADGKTLLAYPGGKTASSLKLDKDVTAIGAYAFAGNAVLTSVELNKTRSVGAYAFDGCTLLSEVKATQALIDSCGENAFRGTAFYADAANWHEDGTLRLQTQTFGNIKRYVVLAVSAEALSNLVFDNKVYTIADAAFRGNTTIVSVSVTDQLYNIGAYAFEGCTKLESFSYNQPDPERLYTKSIGEGAFMNCSSLTSFTVSQKVASLKEHTFENCTSLTYIIIGGGTSGTPDSALKNTALTEVYYRVLPSGVAQIDAINGTCSALVSLATDKRHLFWDGTTSLKFENHHYWNFSGSIPTLLN